MTPTLWSIATEGTVWYEYDAVPSAKKSMLQGGSERGANDAFYPWVTTRISAESASLQVLYQSDWQWNGMEFGGNKNLQMEQL